jgi:nicotinate phosphoribosyltransferase
MIENRDNLFHPGVSWSLATDLYQLTMAQGYYKSGRADRNSIFHMFYRSPPFGGRYVIAAGLQQFGDWLEDLEFSGAELDFLKSLTGKDGKPVFDPVFLEYLSHWKFRGSIEAVPEGTILFPHEPMVRVRAPLLDAQLLETTVLAIINYQTLIATKASRVRLAAGNDEVLEFGLRRSHGLNGGLSASRAAYIGGGDATSNVMAAAHYNIPVRGTHAHSWVMAFDSEDEAFTRYATEFPHNLVLLVDTFNTIEGVRHAIDVGLRLRDRGADLMGIRLDSGDLAYLSTEARKLLDSEGFQSTKILVSNDLDERLIASLKAQGAPIDIWGVGTKLVTAHDDPALDGVYKLAAVENARGEMVERMKLSEQSAKTSIPGCLDVARLKKGVHCVGDVIFDTFTEEQPGLESKVITIISPEDPWKRKIVSSKGLRITTLLEPFFLDGRRMAEKESVQKIRQRALANLATFDRAILRFENPHGYAAGLSQDLHERREKMRDSHYEVVKARLSANHNNDSPSGKES